MSHHRDARGGQGPDAIHHVAPPFDFHGGGPGLNQSTRVLHGPFHADPVAQKRHVRNDQRPLTAPRDKPGVVHHLLHGHGHRVPFPLNHHSQGIANENGFDARLFNDTGEQRVVRGHDHQWLVFLFPSLKLGHRHTVNSAFRRISGSRSANRPGMTWTP